MKKLLPLLFLLSCTKEIEQCPELLYIATTYENGVVVEELTTNFGRVCGDELEYYKTVVNKIELICPPNQYGRWVLKP